MMSFMNNSPITAVIICICFGTSLAFGIRGRNFAHVFGKRNESPPYWDDQPQYLTDNMGSKDNMNKNNMNREQYQHDLQSLYSRLVEEQDSGDTERSFPVELRDKETSFSVPIHDNDAMYQNVDDLSDKNSDRLSLIELMRAVKEEDPSLFKYIASIVINNKTS